MLETSTLLWVVGTAVGVVMAIAGWLWVYTNSRFTELSKHINESVGGLEREIEKHDERMRNGITYAQADQLIDLKLAPIRDALERNTKATEKLTEVLLQRKA